MKRHFKFIFIFAFLMIVGICNGSALGDSVHIPNYENYRYIMETESFANGSNRPVIFTINGTDYFCSHLHLKRNIMKRWIIYSRSLPTRILLIPLL